MKKLAILVGALLIGGCASTGTTPMKTSDATDFPTLIKEAEAAVKHADSMGGAWRDSQKFIDDAKAAAEKGDDATAMKLAKKAKREGEMAGQQAMEQQGKAGPWLF